MTETKRMISIYSRKFDGKIHRSWKAELVEKKNNLLLFVGIFENEVRHSKLGVIRRGTVSYEYYWLDRWFSIFRFHEPEGDLRNYYCNVNMPPKFENDCLDYIDLDVDILLWKDFSLEILDLEEFEQNKIIYGYSEDLILKTYKTLNELQEMIRLRSFPFS
jgi:uncharacterized protein